MNWIWPLKTDYKMFPDTPGLFATQRRHDTHTGVDLYCELGTEVVAVESGVVVGIEQFTGEGAESPWWNDTWAVIIQGDSGNVVYGEIAPKVSLGQEIEQGQLVGVVEQSVLKKFKGRPMTMLHLELMTPDQTTCVWWRDEKPECLLDPTPFLEQAAGEQLTHFDLESYNGKSYRGDYSPFSFELDDDEETGHGWRYIPHEIEGEYAFILNEDGTRYKYARHFAEYSYAWIFPVNSRKDLRTNDILKFHPDFKGVDNMESHFEFKGTPEQLRAHLVSLGMTEE